MPQFVQIAGEGTTRIAELPVPQPGPHEFLVRTVAVALNPTDWECALSEPAGPILGNDYAGVVEALGADVADFKVGDRVAGMVFGNLKDEKHGAFGEYVLGHEHKATRIPDSMSFESASTLGVAITTIGESLYQTDGLNLPWPGEGPTTPYHVLIYGGSSTMGTMAIQFAKLSGATVLATCSAKNTELVYSYGADKVFDRADPDMAEKIREYTGGKLKYAVDAIGLPGTLQEVEKCMSDEGGSIHSVQAFDPAEHPTKFRLTFLIAYSAWGENYTVKGFQIPASQYHKDEATKFWALCRNLIQDGKLKPHPAKLMPGGLRGISEGLQQLKDHVVSGAKLVYRIDGTVD